MTRLFGIALVLVTVFVVGLDACFIQQCPFTIGMDSYESGKIKKDNSIFKRSLPQFLRLRQCAMCSDGLRIGQCFGPEICCFRDGCMIGKNSLTVNCMVESVSNRPCLPHGAIPCSVGAASNPKEGFCSTSGVCCSDNTCVASRQCEGREEGLETATAGQA